MLNFHKDHRSLVIASFIGFLLLSLGVAVIPAYQSQENVVPLPGQLGLTFEETEGLRIYISEGCVACHTQQVRAIEMDKIWGNRPSMPSDYFYSKQRLDLWRQSPSLLGSERTGPDLTNIGQRQPGIDWHLLHLYNPRTVVKESIMPGYPWLFEEKSEPGEADVVVPVPPFFVNAKDKSVVASPKALNLVAYLQSLKQAPLPDNSAVDFIPSKKKNDAIISGALPQLPDGESLYMQTCSACHQADGKGLPGAFPSLVGSSMVNDENFENMVRTILQGYDARTEFGVMPGFAEQLSDAEIAAIANHERTNWGNNASTIAAEDVKMIRESIMALSP